MLYSLADGIAARFAAGLPWLGRPPFDGGHLTACWGHQIGETQCLNPVQCPELTG